MRLLHYIEIENFKRFGDKQRIELDHPAVLVGPNNCGKTSAIQALALWAQSVKVWYDIRKESSAKERPATGLNRLNIVAVPVQRTRFFWHNTRVQNVPLNISVGVEFNGKIVPLTMKFSHRGDELVYCTPDEDGISNIDLVKHAASLSIELLYPMSGLETEEPVLQPGRIDVLLGQGQTAQVLRNLCLIVHRTSKDDWERIRHLMKRLFGVELHEPRETVRGSIELQYHQKNVKEPLDVSSSGRGFQQMLLIFAYLYSHKGGILLVDEPDAHLEILRQKQVYVLLRDIATENRSQVVLVTHSEVIVEEALDKNLTLLLEGKVDNLANKTEIKNSLKYFGAEHYIKARERGYVFYVEGGTDVDVLRGLAEHLNHRVAQVWDERINTFYVQNNYPDQSMNAEIERVAGGYGLTPKTHFDALRGLLPDLKGLAILDGDGQNRQDIATGALKITYWKRYEAENYFVTPDVLRSFAQSNFADLDLFDGFKQNIDKVLDDLILEQVFDNTQSDFLAWKQAASEIARVLWDAKTERRKLSTFAEEFFRRLAHEVGGQMLLTKGELHQLIKFANPKTISNEVAEKLDDLFEVFQVARAIESD
jgi:ABC-type multidrug transport system ATPase subunit